MFYLSGVLYDQYPKVEIHNLARFISVMKFQPLDWRASHPYVLADRMEDLTDPERMRTQPNCDRVVSLYGYVRGTNLKPDSAVHIPGKTFEIVNFMCFLPFSLAQVKGALFIEKERADI